MVVRNLHLLLQPAAVAGCSQGIALVPSGLRSRASDVAVIKPLKEDIQVVTIALAWSADNRRYMQLEGLQTLSDTAPTRLPAVAL